MVRLPSTADVPTVTPGGDPGVQAPIEAFQSPLGVAAQELVPAIEKFAEVKFRQDNRRDMVDRSKLGIAKERENSERIAELEDKDDLSNPDVLENLGKFLAQRRQGSLQLHREQGASEDSLAALEVRLLEIDDKSTGIAAGISTKLGNDAADIEFDNRLVPLGESAAQNPTPDNLRSLISIEGKRIADDFKAGDDPAEERDRLREIGEHVVLSAVDDLIIKGRVEQAEGLLIDGGMNQYLTRELQRSTRSRIERVRFNRDQTTKDLTERERRVQQLTARGMSLELSEDIAAKDVRIVGPDEFGEFFSVNIATGKKTKIEGGDKQAILDVVPTEVPEVPTPEVQPRTIEEAVQIGTGPFAKVQAGVSNVIGPFMAGTIFEDTTNSRQQIRTFNQIAKTGLVNNPRFPVAEQKIVQGLLPDPDRFFQDPDTAKSNLKELESFLVKQKSAKEKEGGKEKISADRRADLADQVSRIDELLSLMEGPKTVNILGKDYPIGTIITNQKGERGKIEPDGTITRIDETSPADILE